MNTFLIILFIIIVLIIVLGIIYINLYNRINESVIRIDEAEARIDSNLREKYDLLQKEASIIKASDNDENQFKDLMKIKSKRLSNFQFDRELNKIYNDLLLAIQSDDKFKEDEEINTIMTKVCLIDEELITLRDYYNGNVTKYNLFVKKIPTNIICKILKYKEKLFYDLKDMKDEDIEDFKI